jgi:hypothetical protein
VLLNTEVVLGARFCCQLGASYLRNKAEALCRRKPTDRHGHIVTAEMAVHFTLLSEQALKKVYLLPI